MKKVFLRFGSLFLVVLTFLISMVSCAKEPYEYDLDEYIKLPDEWKDIKITQVEIERQMKEDIKEVRKNSVIKREVTDRSVRKGDLVKLKVNAFRASEYAKGDRTPIDFLSDQSCTVIIGNGKYPAEFESAVIDHFVNDSYIARLTLPRNFGLAEFASMSMIFEVNVISVTELSLPLYNDAFIKSISSCKTVEEYEDMMRFRAEEKLVWKKIIKLCEVIKYPENELKEYARNYVTYYTNLASEAEIPLETYVAQKFMMNLAAFHDESNVFAKKQIKEEMLLYYFVRKYDLAISDSEYAVGAEVYVKEYGMRSLAALEGKFGSAFVRQSVQLDKVLSYVTSVARKNLENEEVQQQFE